MRHLLPVLCLTLACSGDPRPEPKRHAPPTPVAVVDATVEPPAPPQKLLVWSGIKSDAWKAVKTLEDEQKYEAALKEVAKILESARAAGNSEDVVRAILSTVQSRSALHGYETAVRFLAEVEWPEDLLAQTSLQLYQAHAFVNYARRYSWEVRKREKVVSKQKIDLKQWTWDEIHAAAHRAYHAVWQQRDALGEQSNAVLREYVRANDYPRGIRGTLRDASTYLWVELLAQRNAWRPEHSNEIYLLDLAGLLADAVPLPKLTDPAVHPVEKIAALLADLEAWHRAAGRTEAALEARFVRYEQLHAAFTDADDRTRIRTSLSEALKPAKGVAWWARGVALLAGFIQQTDEPESLVLARDLAKSGLEAYPSGYGGGRCRYIVETLERPNFNLEAMRQDGPNRRTIGVRHKNLPQLHFRAWPFELKRFATSNQDYNLRPDSDDVERFVDGKVKPAYEWHEPLAETPDLREHRTWVNPPIDKYGVYVVAASPDPKFNRNEAPVQVAMVNISDLVMLRRQPAGAIEAHLLDGANGDPRPGAKVELWRYNWRKGHQRVASKTADANGFVRFPGKPGSSHFLWASLGEEIALDAQHIGFGHQPRNRQTRSALVYTDRSVYRPGQTLHWQVVMYVGDGATGRFETEAKRAVTVELRDANNQQVLKRDVTTNAFGSAAGEFVIPRGRALGGWSVRTTYGQRGGTVRVEEYKRPTFEVKMLDPEQPLRLNQPALLKGEARYYFGLPVTAGAVKWRVLRAPVYPWWWGYYYGGGGSQTRVVATGKSALDDSGIFEVRFTPSADERLAKGKARSVTYRYTVSAEVTDEGGETRDASRAVRLGFVAVDAHISNPRQYLDPGTEVELKVKRTDLDGTPAKGEGTWKLVRSKQPDMPFPMMPSEVPLPPPVDGRYQSVGDGRPARWSPTYDERMVLSLWPDGAEIGAGTLTHGDDGEAKLKLPPLEPGSYRVRYTTKDAFGSDFETYQDVLVAGNAEAPIALAVSLKVDRASAQPGDTVRAWVHTGFVEAQPLYLDRWRNGKRLWRRQLRGSTVVDLPVEEVDRGGFGLTVTYLRDHQLLQRTSSIAVPWDSKKLKVSFATFRDTLRPGQAETWTVKVEGPDAKSAAAEVLAYMYDRSLDIFAGHHPPSALSLYPWRGSSPMASSTLGRAQRLWIRSKGFGSSSNPSLRGDQLLFPSGYGVGGPGRRGGRGRYRSRMADGVVPMAAAMPKRAMAEAPAEPEAEAVEELGDELSRADSSLNGGAKKEEDKRKSGGDDNGQAEAPAEMRTNFSETAFWAPQLRTDAEGLVEIEFEVPDSVTAWNVYVHAITKDLSYGTHTVEARTVKELMVRPYLPRFLREGDQAQLVVVVNNAGEKDLAGTVDFDILDAETEQSVLGEFGLAPDKAKGQPFAAKVSGSARLVFPVKAPSRVGALAFKVVAKAGDFSDGELRPIPLLPGRIHLAQSRFTTLKDIVKKTVRFEDLAKDDDPTLINEQLVVTLDGQLFYGVLSALPYLVNYPYECTEQTMNRFLATGILSSLYAQYPAVAKMAKKLSARDTALERWDDDDPNRKIGLEETPWLQAAKGGAAKDFEKVLDPRIAGAQRKAALAKLRKAQTSLGGFPWFAGGPPSPYITLYLLHGFSKAIEFGVDVPRDMVVKAWRYLKKHRVDEAVRHAMAHDCCWEFITMVNYVLSNYPAGWGTEVFPAAMRKQMLDFGFSHWKQHSPYLKGLLALTLARADRKEDAMLVWGSVLDSAKETEDQGTFWAPEDRSWLWYNDTIETHAFALRATMELKPKWAKLDGMVLWLFINKKLNHWKSTKATAEVVYSLAHYLKATGQLGIREETEVTVGDIKQTFVFEPDEFTGKKNQIVVPGPKIDAEKHSAITFDKKTKGFQLASATWHFSTERMPAEARGDFLKVNRSFYRRVKTGREVTLEPLKDGAKLAVGDELEVQLSIRSKHALEYVHLRDPRGAGFEPTSVRSQHKWDLGIGWYEEIRDSGTNFFFESLPVGEYTFKYRVRCATAGTFKVAPALIQPMYAPEFVAYSAGNELSIEPAK